MQLLTILGWIFLQEWISVLKTKLILKPLADHSVAVARVKWLSMKRNLKSTLTIRCKEAWSFQIRSRVLLWMSFQILELAQLERANTQQNTNPHQIRLLGKLTLTLWICLAETWAKIFPLGQWSWHLKGSWTRPNKARQIYHTLRRTHKISLRRKALDLITEQLPRLLQIPTQMH